MIIYSSFFIYIIYSRRGDLLFVDRSLNRTQEIEKKK